MLFRTEVLYSRLQNSSWLQERNGLELLKVYAYDNVKCPHKS
jgi:hypothetical protein